MFLKFNEDVDFVLNDRPSRLILDLPRGSVHCRLFVDSGCHDSSVSTDVVPDRSNMQLRTSTTVGDGGFRLSVSSTPSSSSQSSGLDDVESLGDVYVWGESWSDGGSIPVRTDLMIPKPLESTVVLDVHQMACGVRHFALVTRQGEVFTWGEESGGRLGHGTDNDLGCPRLVESLAIANIDSVACGEYHTCAVSSSGDLFSWGDGSYHARILGHGTDISHSLPKRVSGPLEGLQVLSITCGTWHSALVASNGKVFTFGDGSFGVLGHGDRESAAYPREVRFLSGSKTSKVACGAWHTAAIVEGSGSNHPGGTNVQIPRKLYTWGDGNKNRLGHGNKETFLLPTTVAALSDYNFQQIACGNNMTIALTTSGHVFTMGSSEYGELGNNQSDGILPCLVQDKLVGEFVEEISCGAFHVAVLTSRSEVFTWGRGENGRLGHGDTGNRTCPTLVDSLKDKLVKRISCGSRSSACICIHKWVSGADHTVCSECRQAFGFTRKRHNCYNCGLVHCHGCSSKKALRAALAPTPGKLHRVCDSCYAKLKPSESSGKKKPPSPQHFDTLEGLERGTVRSSKLMFSPGMEHQTLRNCNGIKSLMGDSFSRTRVEVLPLQTQQASSSRSASPYSPRRPSPPRSTTPVFTRSVIDSVKKTNELLNLEVANLQGQIGALKQKCDTRDVEFLSLEKKAQEAALLATQESSKSAHAKDILKSVATLFKEMSEKMAVEMFESENFKVLHGQVEAYLNTEINSNDDSGKQISEKFEPGVYAMFNQLGTFERIKFSKRRFNEEQAAEWWEENKYRVYKKYGVPTIAENPTNPPTTEDNGNFAS